MDEFIRSCEEFWVRGEKASAEFLPLSVISNTFCHKTCLFSTPQRAFLIFVGQWLLFLDCASVGTPGAIRSHYVSAAELGLVYHPRGNCQGEHGRQQWYETLSSESVLMPAGWGKRPSGALFTCWRLASLWRQSAPSRLPRKWVTRQVCFMWLLARKQWPGVHTSIRGQTVSWLFPGQSAPRPLSRNALAMSLDYWTLGPRLGFPDPKLSCPILPSHEPEQLSSPLLLLPDQYKWQFPGGRKIRLRFSSGSEK